MKRAALAVLAVLAVAAIAAEGAAATERALRIAEGSVARSQVVAVGRDVEIDGEAGADVAAVQGDARVRGRVRGSVVVLGGDAELGPAAVVDGDVFVLGGELSTAPGARIGGRAVAYPSVSRAWLTMMEGPSLGLAPTAPAVIAAKLALLAGWLLVTLFLMATGGRLPLETSARLVDSPVSDFVTGVTAVVALFLTALAVAALTPGVLAMPLLVLVVLLALLLKLWGMVAVFHALGEALGRVALRRRLQPVNAACLGLVALGALKLVPWVGTLAWWAATFVGVGAALATKFGRREPWLEPAPSAVS